MELLLGGDMVDIELDPAHYNLALNKALEKYRQRSENAVEESYLTINFSKEVDRYELPKEVIEVRDIYRNSLGGNHIGQDFEPFQAQYMNTYLMNAGIAGGPATFDAMASARELLGRLFGSELTFTWNYPTHTLTIHRLLRADEMAVLQIYNYRPELALFADMYALPWIKDYALAKAKYMVGEAREKFLTVAGPSGGSSLNGAALKSEATADIDRLEQELTLYSEGSVGLSFVIG